MKAAWREGGWSEYARIDLQSFYDSIPHDKLFRVLQQRIRKPEILSAIRQAVATPTVPVGVRDPGWMRLLGVPQGLPISNTLAELYLQEIDAHFLAKPQAQYFRYVDDVIVLTREHDAKEYFDQFVNLASKRGLGVHPLSVSSKSAVQPVTTPFDYLGYQFGQNTIGVRNSSVARIEAKIAKTVTSYRYALNRINPLSEDEWRERCIENLKWKLNLVISGCVLDGERRGWLTYYSQIDDLALLKKLDRLVITFLRRVGIHEEISPKTFVKTWWALNHPNARRKPYVVNLDELDRGTQEDILVRQFYLHRRSLQAATTEEVTEIFHARMRRFVSDLESDIGARS